MIECTLLSLYLSLAERTDCDRESPPPLVVEYYERPPYAWTGQDGEVHGLSADALRAALKRSGQAFRFVAVPSTRQLLDILHGAAPVCAVGRYKTPEREQEAKFSRMLVEERPYVALTRGDSGLGGEVVLDDLLRDPRRRVVTKLQKSYGARIDAALASARSPLVPITGNALNAARMVESGRADIAFLTLDEVEFVIKALDLPPSSYAISRIAGLDRGEKNYLMCNKAADDATLRSLDSVLAAGGG